jgi:hypothetical protein
MGQGNKSSEGGSDCGDLEGIEPDFGVKYSTY